jgi:hypothetical protein
MAYFGFHGRYKKHCYEDCKDLKNKNFIEILNLDPSTVPSNILTNSCIFKKINKQDYITSIQLDAIQHLLMIKNSARTKDSSNYKEVKDRIIRLFKNKYSEFCQEFDTFNTTNKGPMIGRDLFTPPINDTAVYPGYTKSLVQKARDSQIESLMNETHEKIVGETMVNNDIEDLERRFANLKSGGKKSSKRKRKTRRRKSKKCFSLF